MDDNDRYSWNAFYFNREDGRIIVPKRNRWVGFTFNFARNFTRLLVVALLLLLYLIDQIG